MPELIFILQHKFFVNVSLRLVLNIFKIKAVFSSRKSLDFGTVAHFVVI